MTQKSNKASHLQKPLQLVKDSQQSVINLRDDLTDVAAHICARLLGKPEQMLTLQPATIRREDNHVWVGF